MQNQRGVQERSPLLTEVGYIDYSSDQLMNQLWLKLTDHISKGHKSEHTYEMVRNVQEGRWISLDGIELAYAERGIDRVVKLGDRYKAKKEVSTVDVSYDEGTDNALMSGGLVTMDQVSIQAYRSGFVADEFECLEAYESCSSIAKHLRQVNPMYIKEYGIDIIRMICQAYLGYKDALEKLKEICDEDSILGEQVKELCSTEGAIQSNFKEYFEVR